MKEYFYRIIDEIIEKSDSCLIEGCKWSGKTTTAKQHAKSIVELQNNENKEMLDKIYKANPFLFLEGEKPLVIDEWQTYPAIASAIKTSLEKTYVQGGYILTSSLNQKQNLDNKITKIKMRPMSLYESKESDGKISLHDLFERKEYLSAKAEITFENILQYILRGGWPVAKVLEKENLGKVAKNYYKSLIYKNNEQTNKRYSSKKMSLILKAITKNIETPINLSNIEKEITIEETLARNTLETYIELLRNLFILDNTPAWNGRINSKIAIRTKERLELTDPSIGCAALDLNESLLKNDIILLENLFKNLCMRDVKIYAESLGAKVYYYKDETGLEIDAIIVLPNSDWGAVKIGIGSGYIKEANETLLKFKAKVDTNIEGEPTFLMVLVGDEYSYQQKNGIYVVSIGNLKN